MVGLSVWNLCRETTGMNNMKVFNFDGQEVTDNKSVLSLPILILFFSIQISTLILDRVSNSYTGYPESYLINIVTVTEMNPTITGHKIEQQHGSLAATELFCRNEGIMLSFHHKHKAA